MRKTILTASLIFAAGSFGCGDTGNTNINVNARNANTMSNLNTVSTPMMTPTPIMNTNMSNANIHNGNTSSNMNRGTTMGNTAGNRTGNMMNANRSNTRP